MATAKDFNQTAANIAHVIAETDVSYSPVAANVARATAKMIAEAAVCLLQDAQDTAGGIWTTAPALGDALIKRLQAHAGLSFAVEAS